jgi:IS5 family transposase
MLRLRDGQSTLWEELLPAEARLLSTELAAVDNLLDDDRFLSPFVERFSCPIGRPTIPMETYLRLMYLKHRYGLGYETLVKEVADSLSWRRFCRIGLGASVPHPTTLMKLTRRFGPGIVEQLNEALLKAAVEQRVLRSRRVRIDTTVMEADIRYPTDSGLCAHAISRVSRAVRRVKAVGLAARSRFRDRRRAAGKVIRNVSHSLGRSRGRAAIDRLTGEVHRLAKTTLDEARHVLSNAQRGLRRRPRPGQGWVARLADEIERAERVIKQTTRRLAGERIIPDRVISLADTDARPIRRGKPQRPTEFGYKVSIADTPEGFVVSHQVYIGAPADTDTLGPALDGAQATGMRMRTVLADRGYGNEVADRILASHGISDKVVPRVGAAAPVERTRAWRRRYRFRAGAEGRISHLKRRHGLSRTRLKGHTGATIWAGYGVLAHNLDRMVALS